MTRKALVVGVDYYQHLPALRGCARDAQAVARMLERHADGSPNCFTKLLVADVELAALSRRTLKTHIGELFQGAGELAILYFAGHGHLDDLGGFVLSSDCAHGDDGVPLGEILAYANRSRFHNRIVILDSCHSGVAGRRIESTSSELSEGTTILTASGEEQYALEGEGGGLFTSLLVDALGGAASNLVGAITPGAVYAHIDQSLGAWEQRPVFKTNVSRFVSMRNAVPPLSLDELRKISELFPRASYQLDLDPSFEPESDRPQPENVAIFRTLQKYNRVNLVVPLGAPHMYHAAMQHGACKLTALGEHYRRLSQRGRI